jgi:hypothetical protein
VSTPQPLQYVKICSLYGAGFYYMPGTDTCLKVGGYVRAEVNYQAGGSFAVPATLSLNNRNAFVQDWRTRAAITLDARSQTEYGTLRSYLFISATDDNSMGGAASGTPAVGNGTGASGYNRLYAPAAFIQFAGFTAGKTDSFFNFDTQSYSNQSNFWGSNQGGNGVDLFAYTAQFGNGLSASIAAENAEGHRMGITNAAITGVSGITYANGEWPDVVGNLRIDQAWGSAQVMGAAHQVRATDIGAVSNHPGDETGWAIGAGIKLNAPMLGKGDSVIAQFTYAKGAMDYVASGSSALQTVNQDFPITSTAYGPMWDAVVVPGNSLDLTKGWSITGGYEHHWNTQWKTSLYGAYGKVEYSDAASAVLLPGTATVGSSANWDYWQIGSRTVWTPVTNLDLSLEVMYNNMDTAFTGPTLSDKDWVSGMFRVQRNFYP